MASVLALILCLCLLLFNVTGFLVPLISRSAQDDNHDDPEQLFDDLDRYVFKDYDSQTPFSDFLPGLAGIYGKPLYAFYVNRGQGIASFGIESKQYPIMEYFPADQAYQNTPLLGFRTFVQGKRGNHDPFVSEPFSPLATQYSASDATTVYPKRVMYAGENEVQIQEIDSANQLETNVTYFVLPEEDFGAFVRHTTISNTHRKHSITLSVLDGLARMQPYGGEDMDDQLKTISNTLGAWMRVKFPYDDSISQPFYRLTTEAKDSESVKVLRKGHYCMAMIEDSSQDPDEGIESYPLLPIVYDTDKVFGKDTTLLRPVQLFEKSIADIVREPQFGAGHSSSCFAAVRDVTLKPGETVAISTFFGSAGEILDLPVIARRITQPGFVRYKLTRSRELIKQITESIETKTANKLFDEHVKQSFLDNSLRGGIPVILGDVDDGMENVDEDPRIKVFHVFSRIHGDLERDYNRFKLSPTFFSQGPGNFRDVAQNRRNDVAFNPKVGSFNVRMFLSFIQADGYEPLSVEAVVFTIPDLDTCIHIAEQSVGRADGHRAQREALSGILNGGPFRPGQLFSLMEDQHIELIISRQDFIDMVAAAAETNPMAVYDTGFWADHWTYYLDMIESYTSIFPEGEERLLYDRTLPYFFSPASVQPRHKKYVLSLSYDGYHQHVRQLESTTEDAEKQKYRKQFVLNSTGWYSSRAFWQSDEDGDQFQSDVVAKLFLLATIKFATRDPYGMGIEYEAGRPGWDDAHNGLPSMIGSGMPETFELKALLSYILRVTKQYHRPIIVPLELSHLVHRISESLRDLEPFVCKYSPCPEIVPKVLFDFWDRVATAREEYREQTKVSFSGNTSTLESEEIVEMMERWIKELDLGIERAILIGSDGYEEGGSSGSDITPTYFAYDVTQWNLTGHHNKDGHPLVNAVEMAIVKLPLFLEGPTRMMKTVDESAARDIYGSVKASALRDKTLSMYTLSASLNDQPLDIGRSMAFPPGWLENQSVWLHMSYKFYLQLLRKSLLNEFYDEAFNGGLVPYMDGSVYGRSLRECSSFIVSSVFDDPSMRGRGFLPRLSGSTAEFLSMWFLMFVGPKPFFVDDHTGELRMEFVPSIPASFFRTKRGDDSIDGKTPYVRFKLFSSIKVIYYNEEGKDIFGMRPYQYRIGLRDGSTFNVNASSIPRDLATKIRRVVFVDFIEAYF
eukprot:scaffold22660_cov127-Cylindrotheca_fusiformis.AAC.5